MIRTLLPCLAILALGAGSAAAQESGGRNVGGVGPVPANFAIAFAQSLGQPLQLSQKVLAPPPINRDPIPVSAFNPANKRTVINQQAIASIRGDAGFLQGFVHGQPLAPSRQPPPPPPPPPVINFNQTLNQTLNQDIKETLNQTVNLSETQQVQIDAPLILNNKEGGSLTVNVPTAAAGTPQALAGSGALNGGLAINAVNSPVNLAIGSNNTAVQQVQQGQDRPRRAR